MELTASCKSDMERGDWDVPARKRHCGEYALEIHNLPDAAFKKPSMIRSFFSPIEVKSCECDFLQPAGTLWKVNFCSQRDMDIAFKEKQWQYLGTHCIRLSQLDEHHSIEEKRGWMSVHQDLQLEILSHFDCVRGPWMRRVCKQWNALLKKFLDREVNRCLLYECRTDKYVNSKQMFKNFLMDMVEGQHHAVEGSCGRISRLILKFRDDSGPEDFGMRVDADYIFPDSDEFRASPGLFETYLREYGHFDTIVFSGIRFATHEISLTANQIFEGEPRWTRATKLVFHDCGIVFYHRFARPVVSVVSELEHIKYVENPTFASEEGPECWHYALPVSGLAVEVNPEMNGTDRRAILQRELDKHRLYWQFPPAQLEWLKGLLRKLPLHDSEELITLNRMGHLSLRQAIRRYFEMDAVQKTVPDWEPTGVHFEKFQLSWRDCFFFASLAALRHLLGPTMPPYDVDPRGEFCWSG